MTSIKGLLFIAIFAGCVVGALFLPHLGVYGYLADYCLHPAGQWYGRPFARLGIRFSFILALVTIAGIFFQYDKLKFGEKFLYKQEIYLLLFLVVVWVTHFIGPPTIGRYTVVNHPVVKFTKIVIFVLVMTHVITDLKKLQGLFLVLLTVSLLLGLKAWQTPYHAFVGGRLEGIGGADFAESNFFAAFMASMLPLIGVAFLRSRKWLEKVYCVISGAFTANAVVLCRSRGAFLGLVAGALSACVYAPREHRQKIFVLILIGIVGVVYLSDEAFINRITKIATKQSQMDESEYSRIRLWQAGAEIFMDHPLGIGPGNWYQTIGHHIPEYQGKDSHSTYVKCVVETGIFGAAIFIALLLQAYFNLRHVYLEADNFAGEDVDEFKQYYFALLVSIAVMLTCALAITMIYIEIFWVLLMLPVCLRRALDNHLSDHDQIDAEVMVEEL